MKRAIDFMIIGAAKSGTTTLYNALATHPDIFLPEIKENLYFARDYGIGDDYLAEFYRSLGNEAIVGGNYVHAMYFPEVIERLYAHNPNMKLIAILRDPVKRAYSAYWFAVRNGLETLSFEEAIELDSARAAGSYLDRAEKTYLSHGLYAQQLRHCTRVFPRRQLYIVTTDMLQSQTERLVADILAFLGTNTPPDGPLITRHANPAAQLRVVWLQRMMLREDALYKRIGRRVFPARLRYWINRTLAERIVNQWNLKKFDYPPMSEGIRAKLTEYYRSSNRETSETFGVDICNWAS